MTMPLSLRLKSLFRAGLVASAVLPAVAAQAHPHVFVVAKEEVIFGPDGLVTGVRHTWKFDDMYSSFIVQGLGPEGQVLTREQLAPLAKTNVESLAEFGYFTVVKAAGKQSEFDAPVDYWSEESSDKLVTLHFTLPLKKPASAKTVLSLAVYDPTYFVAFSLDDKTPVMLSAAPSGCSASVSKPKALDATDNQKLSESFFTNLSPGMDFGIKLAERAIIACP
ncbi:DUF1007 family protein [Lichenihabitans sp. PAMC28606]|uniref:DUF1007 family protein n=1 Tax=Lichenihabitans sp. PAMC28606 TaxID=2880932 RepID=UPI001D0A7179|nr:DUF1007 family protein [Lichenihabitans sp. PAMC28606]UDL96268.1 DUF1007 family protein [Lichenihabitans sp. PAMC28606]